jgi:hypothetical protein
MARYDKRGRLISPLRRASAKKNVVKARHVWIRMSHLERQKSMPAKKYAGLTQKQIKQKIKKAGKRYVPIGGYAWLDVGRPKHHYVLAQKTKYGWTKKTGLVPRKTLQKIVGKARTKWMRMTHAQRIRVTPERKGKAGYHKVPITAQRKGRTIHTFTWERT